MTDSVGDVRFSFEGGNGKVVVIPRSRIREDVDRDAKMLEKMAKTSVR